MKRFLEIVKWSVWLSALVGAVCKVLSFSRIYMRRNIGHEHMHRDRAYLCLWLWGGNYIFLTDVYGKDYKDTSCVAQDLNIMDLMRNYDWSFTVRTWGDNHGADPKYKTCAFNDLGAELISPIHRWMIWRHLQMYTSMLCPGLHVPSQFHITLSQD